MKTKILILTGALLWAAAAVAQIDENENGIGIYADLGGMVNEVEMTSSARARPFSGAGSVEVLSNGRTSGSRMPASVFSSSASNDRSAR